MDMLEVLCVNSVFDDTECTCGWGGCWGMNVCVSACVRVLSTYLSYSFVQDIDGFFCTKGELARIIANNLRINVPSSNRY